MQQTSSEPSLDIADKSINKNRRYMHQEENPKPMVVRLQSKPYDPKIFMIQIDISNPNKDLNWIRILQTYGPILYLLIIPAKNLNLNTLNHKEYVLHSVRYLLKI